MSRKLIQKSNFKVQGMFFQQLYWEKSKPDRMHFWIPLLSDLALTPLCICATIFTIKNLHYIFLKMRGVDEGSLEFFRTFIRFGSAPFLKEGTINNFHRIKSILRWTTKPFKVGDAKYSGFTVLGFEPRLRKRPF